MAWLTGKIPPEIVSNQVVVKGSRRPTVIYPITLDPALDSRAAGGQRLRTLKTITLREALSQEKVADRERSHKKNKTTAPDLERLKARSADVGELSVQQLLPLTSGHLEKSRPLNFRKVW